MSNKYPLHPVRWQSSGFYLLNHDLHRLDEQEEDYRESEQQTNCANQRPTLQARVRQYANC